MSTILFDKAVFGPVQSRRLGCSLGINLLPVDRKVCTFDCLYCECGYTARDAKTASALPTRAEVNRQLEKVLKEMRAENKRPDVITFAGNGEPTLHPQFAEIIDDVCDMRDRFAPEAKICVLTNATKLGDEKVAEALCQVDEAILKIDSGRQETAVMLNQPKGDYSLEKVVEQIIGLRERLGDALTIQTMFVSWQKDGAAYDNTCEADVEPWLEILRRIAPPRLMIYTIARETPLQTMEKTSKEVLDALADRAREIVEEVSVSY